MSTNNEIHITPTTVSEMLDGGGQSAIVGDDFFISRLTDYSHLDYLKYPFKIDCCMAIFCKSGSLSCSVNMTKYHLESGSLLFVEPGKLVQVISNPETVASSGSQFTIVCSSVKFLSMLEIDINSILNKAASIIKQPFLKLSEESVANFSKYYELICDLAKDNSNYSRKGIIALATSMYYYYAGIMDKQTGTEDVTPVRSSRQKMLFDRFLELVITNHTKERMVGFYADKLCVTPKYLSKIVKEYSGTAAPGWINNFVILTAQHMLKHSDMSIKEIASELNFVSQPFFFRFFKNHTGMTPSQYRYM